MQPYLTAFYNYCGSTSMLLPNKDYISRDDFADIFEQTATHIMNERIEEKRHCFQNVFVNSMVASSCSYDKTEKFMRLLVDMS